MKIIHTSDWHIGKLVHGVHLTADQQYLLNQLIKLIETEKPQVLIIAGDIYDRSVPPIEAVLLLDEILSQILLQLKTKVIIIAGNHDSPDRLGFANKILKSKGLTIAGKLTYTIEPIIINDQYGEVHFYPIPYTDYPVVRNLYEDKNIKSHDSAMLKILSRINKKLNPQVRNVCITHGYLLGGSDLITSDSERPLAIGGSEYIDVEYFKHFNYVALGHLHQAQKVKYNHIRYAGSLMKYSFSEAKQRKSVTIVNLAENGEVKVELKQLKPLRDLRVIKGELKQLIAEESYKNTNINDYIKADLTDKGELIDAMSKLRTVYPNILKLERKIANDDAGENKTSASSDFLKKNSLELFKEFYENISKQEFTEVKQQVIASVINELNIEGRQQ